MLGVVLDLAISIVLANTVINLSNVSSSAHQSRVGLYQACLQTNNYRQVDLIRWNEVLKLIDTMPQNEALQKFVAGVKAANALADTAQKCTVP